MLLKFLVLCVAPLQFVNCSVVKEHTNLTLHHGSLSLVDIETIEKDLGAEKCQESSTKTKKLLEYLTANGVSFDIIGKKFNCKSNWVSRFLNNESPGLTLVGNVRSYYMAGGDPLSLILLIQAEEEKQKKSVEAATWHFSDALCWLPFGGKSTATSSTRSSDEGTPRNDSLSSQGSTPPKAVEDSDKQPLLGTNDPSQEQQANQSGLRRRHPNTTGDRK